ncbi:hypothetical protein [Devosia sp.]|uniref:hypothetical protein n=1 Tax=Devosia sp. TaxID=1871048 RepID=UPI001AC386E2|nr:hypothetical protein [Devosia sp.]MBN9333272.1 hypothetical protein [Devosia sp.]
MSGMTYPFAKFAALQRAAARSLAYHDEALSEAIMHHCALKVASATAPTDGLVGQYVGREIKQFHALLRMQVPDLEGIAVRGRYLKAYMALDQDYLEDAGTPEALIDGLAGAA